MTGFLRERIADYKVPRTVEFVDSPLRDDAGKARRSAVRAEIIDACRPGPVADGTVQVRSRKALTPYRLSADLRAAGATTSCAE